MYLYVISHFEMLQLSVTHTLAYTPHLAVWLAWSQKRIYEQTQSGQTQPETGKQTTHKAKHAQNKETIRPSSTIF